MNITIFDDFIDSLNIDKTGIQLDKIMDYKIPYSYDEYIMFVDLIKKELHINTWHEHPHSGSSYDEQYYMIGIDDDLMLKIKYTIFYNNFKLR